MSVPNLLPVLLTTTQNIVALVARSPEPTWSQRTHTLPPAHLHSLLLQFALSPPSPLPSNPRQCCRHPPQQLQPPPLLTPAPRTEFLLPVRACTAMDLLRVPSPVPSPSEQKSRQ